MGGDTKKEFCGEVTILLKRIGDGYIEWKNEGTA